MEDSSACAVKKQKQEKQAGQNRINEKQHINTEELLDQSSMLLIETLNKFQDGIFVFDTNWNFTYLNRRAAEIVDLNPADIIGKNLWREFPQLKGTVLEKNYQIAMQTQQIRQFETKGIGTETWFDITVYPSKKGLIVHWHEITKRKQAQKALEKERSILSGIIEQTGAMIAYLDLNFNFIIVNSAYAKGSGYTVEQLIGKNHFELFPNKENQAIFEKVRDTGEPVKFLDKPFQFANQPQRGITYWDWTLSPVKNPQGKIQGVIITLMETTERKKAEQALEQAQAQLQRYAQNLEQLIEERTKQLQEKERMAAIGQTAGMVGHDIRNPLQAIVGDLYLLKDIAEDIPSEEDKSYAKELIDGIEDNINYINKIISDLQDYARKTKPKLEEVDLKQAIQKVLLVTDIPKNISISYFVKSDIKLKADDTYIRRILTNLITNAIQAMPSGGELTIDATYQDNRAMLIVADTGQGIPKEAQDKLFTPLFTTKSKGQGFGLAVVKKFVDQLGGTISYESQVGKGTKFIVTLPIKR